MVLEAIKAAAPDRDFEANNYFLMLQVSQGVRTHAHTVAGQLRTPLWKAARHTLKCVLRADVLQAMAAAEKLDAVSVHISGISKVLREHQQQQQQSIGGQQSVTPAAPAQADGLATPGAS